MSEKAFSRMMRGLKEARAYMAGEGTAYKVGVPTTLDVKGIRKRMRMTQASFSLDAAKLSLAALISIALLSTPAPRKAKARLLPTKTVCTTQFWASWTTFL